MNEAGFSLLIIWGGVSRGLCPAILPEILFSIEGGRRWVGGQGEEKDQMGYSFEV